MMSDTKHGVSCLLDLALDLALDLLQPHIMHRPLLLSAHGSSLS